MVLDPNTFACTYMISGGLAGGAMTDSEFLIALTISVVDGLEVMLGCMLLVEIFLVLAPLFIIAAYISAICVGFSIGWHIGTFINTGDVRELQERMLELITFSGEACFIAGTLVLTSLGLVQVSAGGETITATLEHPFYVAQKGFVKTVRHHARDIK